MSILSAAAIAPLLKSDKRAPKNFACAGAAGCLGVIFLQMALLGAFPEYNVPITTHIPSIATFALLIATLTYLFRRNAASTRAFLLAAGVAVGAAGASNIVIFR
ncbi:MAG: hypothetical protein R3C42_08645 [Parvularculaceae bacterium]